MSQPSSSPGNTRQHGTVTIVIHEVVERVFEVTGSALVDDGLISDEEIIEWYEHSDAWEHGTPRELRERREMSGGWRDVTDVFRKPLDTTEAGT